MAVLICVAGAVAGVIISMIGSRLTLPMVLKALAERLHDPPIRLPLIPAALTDPRRLRALTITVHRYVMPLVFAYVGGMAAYYLFIVDAP
jgi:hypothetical protein